MIYLILAALFVAALLYREHAHEKEMKDARDEWRLERIALLNRIQAPELVAAQAAPDPSDEPLYVPYDDDAAHDAYIEARIAGDVT